MWGKRWVWRERRPDHKGLACQDRSPGLASGREEPSGCECGLDGGPTALARTWLPELRAHWQVDLRGPGHAFRWHVGKILIYFNSCVYVTVS